MTVELRDRLTCTVPEAGAALGLGRDAAYSAAKRGEIPVLQFGRRLVVPVPKLLELLGMTPDMRNGEALTSPLAPTSRPGEANAKSSLIRAV